MDTIHIQGGRPLAGTVQISGSKNAALPLMAAALLTDEPLALANVPRLMDIDSMAGLLEGHGAGIVDEGGENGAPRRLTIRVREIADTTAPYDLVRKMRASVLVLGPLLARCGEARVSLPGGCAIGTRPVDLHLKALTALGAEIELEDGYIVARAPQGLTGARIAFPQVSVGATENALMAAALAAGETVIANAAREPEIGDLAGCLTAMGARIEGIGSDTLVVTGVERLHGADYEVIADRIEAGSFAIAAAITGGRLELEGARLDHLEAFAETLAQAGVTMRATNAGIEVARANGAVRGVGVTTEPYPGFPTDLQAQFMALAALAEGTSVISEHIFENRFMHVPELVRMGADIEVHGAEATVRGVRQLRGAPVMATDLRASMSLVLAGLAAQGETVVNRVYHIDRGYERIVRKLQGCGAEIERAPR
jgi:UDP-N-acetylglucosamine 1-carboxyvinyltransferase